MAVDPSKIRIICIDDYKTMLRIIINLLRQLGFSEIDEATDGVTAYEKIQEKNYDLIISDWNMEPMSGLELLKKVRANPHCAKVPFIMVTAESKPENVIIAKQAGVTNYIVKPFNLSTLKNKLTAVLGEF